MITFQCVHSITAWWKHVNKEYSRLDWTTPKVTLISLLQEKNDHFILHAKNFIANHPSCINNFYLSRRKKKKSVFFFFLVQYLWSFLCFKRPDPLIHPDLFLLLNLSAWQRYSVEPHASLFFLIGPGIE